MKLIIAHIVLFILGVNVCYSNINSDSISFAKDMKTKLDLKYNVYLYPIDTVNNMNSESIFFFEDANEMCNNCFKKERGNKLAVVDTIGHMIYIEVYDYLQNKLTYKSDSTTLAKLVKSTLWYSSDSVSFDPKALNSYMFLTVSNKLIVINVLNRKPQKTNSQKKVMNELVQYLASLGKVSFLFDYREKNWWDKYPK
jgi:hypothetical protein